ncbi:hypothetical protein DUNSADRAFT_8422 [Dunaliella salina]|uniref:Uncharacterized protein n=1 Tax=Dunaliella salina TaxID=3046 RepID=A0ABQ7GJJ4_DUNSA|nr:hypothetical protein DUNSADRAFT_8422 [Dunaliella salina]|eukprot:KAF5834781.1 hypothetical protein DUNSADRAFT_8422 [Dunaliella salina]
MQMQVSHSALPARQVPAVSRYPRKVNGLGSDVHRRQSQFQQHSQLRTSSNGGGRGMRKTWLALATPEEDAEIEAMKQAATSPPSPMESEQVGIGLKVAVVSLFVGLSIGMAKVAEPIIQTTLARFPTISG